MQYVNWKMRVTLSDTRNLVGTFMAFDKHMNVVLGDAKEFRRLRPKKGEKHDREESREIGLVMIRGDQIVALNAEAPPAPKPRAEVAAAAKGPGVGVAAGRGMPVAPLASAPRGLSGPVRGMGGPANAMMMPQAQSAAPVSYGRGVPPMGGPPPFGGRGRGFPPGGPPPMMGRGGYPGGPPMMGRGGYPGGPPPMMGRGGPPGGRGGPPGGRGGPPGGRGYPGPPQ